ncbi:MAG: cytochrome c biogenesis protein [Cyanobacteria bacterium P01_D01_bin.123]
MNPIKRYFKHEFLPVLADLKLAIVLLLVIAIASSTGTVIEQGEPVGFYQQNYPEHPALFGFLTWKVILAIGLDHVYRTPWFLALLVLFGGSLAACTSTRQIPMLKVARRWSYYTKPRSFSKLALSSFIPDRSLGNLPTLLASKRYILFREGHQVYARKGIVGKIGPIVVHASMLLILGGAIWGSLTGFQAQELIPSGAIAPIQNITEAGMFGSNRFPNWQIQVDRFWIDYATDGHVKQFYSDIAIVDEGRETKRKTIFVNEPIKYKGVTLYQADWDVSSLKVRINNSPQLQLPTVPVRPEGGSKLWGTFVPTKPDMSEGVTVLIPDLQGTVLVYEVDGSLAGSVRQGNSINVAGVALYIDELVGSTGLQIKSDPGIPFVYAGFGLLMLGVMMSYVSHSQIWALETDAGLYVGGKTNRALVAFEREFCDILDRVSTSSTIRDTSLTEEELALS